MASHCAGERPPGFPSEFPFEPGNLGDASVGIRPVGAEVEQTDALVLVLEAPSHFLATTRVVLRRLLRIIKCGARYGQAEHFVRCVALQGSTNMPEHLGVDSRVLRVMEAAKERAPFFLTAEQPASC